MDFNGIFLVAALFIAYVPYKIILKKFKIQVDTNNDSKKTWFIKAIIYWSNFFLVNYILIKAFDLWW
ncbi:hypothetical protein OAA88_00870 [Candidatus Pelagibacter ubique]|nr:hypothetical protein [Candidatus Pelagibacter ubique]